MRDESHPLRFYREKPLSLHGDREFACPSVVPSSLRDEGGNLTPSANFQNSDFGKNRCPRADDREPAS